MNVNRLTKVAVFVLFVVAGQVRAMDQPRLVTRQELRARRESLQSLCDRIIMPSARNDAEKQRVRNVFGKAFEIIVQKEKDIQANQSSQQSE